MSCDLCNFFVQFKRWSMKVQLFIQQWQLNYEKSFAVMKDTNEKQQRWMKLLWFFYRIVSCLSSTSSAAAENESRLLLLVFNVASFVIFCVSGQKKWEKESLSEVWKKENVLEIEEIQKYLETLSKFQKTLKFKRNFKSF